MHPKEETTSSSSIPRFFSGAEIVSFMSRVSLVNPVKNTKKNVALYAKSLLQMFHGIMIGRLVQVYPADCRQRCLSFMNPRFAKIPGDAGFLPTEVTRRVTFQIYWGVCWVAVPITNKNQYHRTKKTTRNAPTGIIVGAFLGGKNVSTSISGSLEGLNTILKLKKPLVPDVIKKELSHLRQDHHCIKSLLIITSILLPCLNLCKTQWTIMFLISTCDSNVIMCP